MTLNASWILQTGILIGVGAVGFFLKDMKKVFESKVNENAEDIGGNAEEIRNVKEKTDQNIKALEDKFNDHRERIAKEYVSKDEFIRAVTSLDKKLDKIYDVVTSERKGAS